MAQSDSRLLVVRSIAALEHLTGPAHGQVSWIRADQTDVGLDERRLLQIVDTTGGASRLPSVASLQRVGDKFEIVALEAAPIWVNGRRVERRLLEEGDTIEFGEDGPLSRFRQLHDGRLRARSVEEIAEDCYAYLRSSRRPFSARVLQATLDLARRLAFETTILFRIAVLFAFIALAFLLYRQHQVNVTIARELEDRAAEIEGVASALAQARTDALRPTDLVDLKREFERRVWSTVERVEALEARESAGARVIADAAASVVFIQGGYGLRDIDTGEMMRLVLAPNGLPIILPTGRPLMSLEAEGPVAEVNFVGTGFLASDGLILTNRHVARPWESDIDEEALKLAGLEPVMVKLIAYLPDADAGGALRFIGASDVADLAVLRWLEPNTERVGLRLASEAPTAGDRVIVMGYPTGLRSILAQAGRDFVERLDASDALSFWAVAERLAEAGRIHPLASQGIVGHAGDAAIVYDAETTYGGSGGPVLNMEGEVVAVNAAVLPEFGGSNLGVPIAEARRLLQEFETR